MKDKIKSYLAKGLQAADIASIVGCSPGYISQLLKDDAFKLSVEAEMLNNPATEDETLNAKYEGVEHKILKNMAAAVDGAELPHLSKALDSISKARDLRERRTNPGKFANHGGANTPMVQVVSVTLPPHALPAPQVLELNGNSEVIGVGNQSFAPMAASAVKNLFQKLVEKKGNSNVLPIAPPGQHQTASDF